MYIVRVKLAFDVGSTFSPPARKPHQKTTTFEKTKEIENQDR